MEIYVEEMRESREILLCQFIAEECRMLDYSVGSVSAF